MTITTAVFGAAAAAALILSPTAASATASQSVAGADEKIRRLDIMLMVTSLRCRFGADNFQPQYESFSSAHLPTLNGAARRLQADMTARHGAKGAARALDDISVKMANQYGQGHPWLGCGELKRIATDLAAARDPAALGRAADTLLASAPATGPRVAAAY